MMKKILNVLSLVVLLGAMGLNSAARAAPVTQTTIVLVEAEAFADLGGWILDQQFMDQMGSPYLLAHGLGRPVRDATTTVQFKQSGKYKLWVRTKDWVAQWRAPGAPGRFQVTIDGKPIPVTFGAAGAQWHWQDGGTVEISPGKVKLALHDLTGFEGRCDALLFSAAAGFVPPAELKALELFRRQALGLSDSPREAGSYDLVVVGGGIAGITASLGAARQGLRVALIQDRPVLGGNNSSEVRVNLAGNINLQPYPRVGDVVKELEQPRREPPGPANVAENFPDLQREALVRREKNITLFLEYRAGGVQVAAGRIESLTARSVRSGETIRVAGRLFADCTGDGVLGVMAGADHEITLKQHMGPSNIWNVVDTGAPAPFPRCPWALDLAGKPFPGRGTHTGRRPNVAQGGKPGLDALGQWFWETGFDWDPIRDVEAMRDWNLRAMYGAWDVLKNVDNLYPTHAIAWAAAITGKRESVRLLGDVILSENDFKNGIKYPDGSFPCTWTIDLHYPHPDYIQGFEGQAFIAYATQGKYQIPFWAPYRCLYSRNVANLFMAGRDISVTHMALGPVRVMRTCGMMGEIVGMAASLCIKAETTPRGVYKDHLDDLNRLMEKGLGR